MSHLVRLGATDWSVWTAGLLRSAGFPADGLTEFAALEAARSADAMLAGEIDSAAFTAAFEAALAANAGTADAVAADPLLLEALTWQNPAALPLLDGLSTAPEGARRNVRRRDREKTLLRYWQRYCGKCETIGFFGPLRWIRCAGADFGIDIDTGPGLTRTRRVFFEAWAMRAFADAFAGDVDVRQWWAPSLRAQLSLRGRLVHKPLRAPVELSPAESAAVAYCDGRSAADVAAALIADPGIGVRATRDAYLLLDRLVEREVLRWDAAVPTSPEAEQVVAERVAAIADTATREPVAGAYTRLLAARDRVAESAGDPGALRAALSDLDAEFTACTGRAPRRRDGQMYAGRTLLYADAERDVDVAIGARVLDRLAEPLVILLRAARWLSAELATACSTVLTELYREQRADEVPLADLWYLAQGLIWPEAGSAAESDDSVGAEFTRRCAKLFGLDEHAATTGEIRLDSAELAERTATLFHATGPGWPSARVHSADIQICAANVAQVETGRCLFVLGELHPASSPADSALFSRWHPDPTALRAGFDHDIGAARLRVLYPESYPRQTGRTQHGLDGPLDRDLGIDDTPGANPDRLVPATAAMVRADGGELSVTTPDGQRWPLLEAFASLLSARLLDTFKLLGTAARTPRIRIDDLVVARETWRTTVADTGLTEVTAERERYLAARRWRLDSGLPERVFVKVGTEVKPCYVDFTSPLSVQMLATMLRSARLEHGDAVSVTLSEMLPAPEQCWLPDAAGNRYASEFRLQFTDPLEYTPAAGASK